MESQASAESTFEMETSPEQMITGSEIVVTGLLEHGIKVGFGYQGGTVIPFFDELGTAKDIRLVTPRHEQGGGHAADGYARVNGTPAFVVVTSGPGATNLQTAISTAFSDGSPMLVITGQVAQSVLGTRAFQEVNVVQSMKSITKGAFQVSDIRHLAPTIHRACDLAMSDRKGPVVIDVPSNIFSQKAVYQTAAECLCQDQRFATANDHHLEALAKEAVAAMRNALRPVIIVGGGAAQIGSKAPDYVQTLADEWNCPVVNTLLGRGVYPSSGDRWLGPTGMHGRPEANKAVAESDLIISIGARLNDRVTGNRNKFAPNARIIQIDVDPEVLRNMRRGTLNIQADAEKALETILGVWERAGGIRSAQNLKPWWKRISRWRRAGGLPYRNTLDMIQPQFAMEVLNDEIKGKDVYIVTDVGQNQMWAHQYLDSEEPNRFVTSGGQGTMGFGLPAAIGVQVAKPDSAVVVVCGDGGFDMTSQEMKTATKYQLPIKVIVLNNHALGMVKQWQKVKQENRFVATINTDDEDLMLLAQARHWTGIRCDDPRRLRASIKKVMATPGPVLFDCRIDPEAVVTPMTRPGEAPHRMIMEKEINLG